MSTFRSVVKPKKKIISTDLAGTLDLEDRFNSIDFSSGQSAPITLLENTRHLIEGQTIAVSNNGSSDVLIDASLMDEGVSLDIEQDTTALLYWMGASGKFKDQGGSARTKDLEENFASHTHNGINSPKVSAMDLDSGTSTEKQFLVSNGLGGTSWLSSVKARFQSFNTNTVTNLSGTNNMSIEVPVIGNVERQDSEFTVIGNTVRCNFTGRIILVTNIHCYTSSNKIDIKLQFAKNGTLIGPASGNYLGTGATHGTFHLVSETDVQQNDIISLRSGFMTTSGTMVMSAPDESSLLILRVE